MRQEADDIRAQRMEFLFGPCAYRLVIGTALVFDICGSRCFRIFDLEINVPSALHRGSNRSDGKIRSRDVHIHIFLPTSSSVGVHATPTLG